MLIFIVLISAASGLPRLASNEAYNNLTGLNLPIVLLNSYFGILFICTTVLAADAFTINSIGIAADSSFSKLSAKLMKKLGLLILSVLHILIVLFIASLAFGLLLYGTGDKFIMMANEYSVLQGIALTAWAYVIAMGILLVTGLLTAFLSQFFKTSSAAIAAMMLFHYTAQVLTSYWKPLASISIQPYMNMFLVPFAKLSSEAIRKGVHVLIVYTCIAVLGSIVVVFVRCRRKVREHRAESVVNAVKYEQL
ncbi:MAG: hypothetical protein ACOZCL_08890 [Bacillota bacterium]